MLELKGKYNHAIVYTDNIESEAISQIVTMLNYEAYKESVIRIMPDVHAGKGCTVGTTMTIKDKVTPSLVGVDISCGIMTTKLKEKEIDLKSLDQVIRKYIPSGFNIHQRPISKEAKAFDKKIDSLKMNSRLNRKLPKSQRYIQSIGTLGGGNHFIAIEQDERGHNYLIVHTGSRSLGLAVAKFYQDLAVENLEKRSNIYLNDRKELIERLKRENREQDIAIELQKLSSPKLVFGQLEKDLAFLERDDLKDYLHDVGICQEYATLNRQTITKIILEAANLTLVEQFETIHNYIDLKNNILRKGAISAQLGEKVLIPLNMRDGSLIAIGKGNPEWNFSACHGAGRLMSRSKAKQSINFEDFKESMKGIYSTSVSAATLDESPFAYKPFKEIIENIKDSVEIISHIKPIYNYKDSTETE